MTGRPSNGTDRAVWITGIGVITAIGIGVDAFRAGLRAGRSPVRRIDRFDPSGFRSQVAAQVDAFDPLDHMDAKTARQLDRFSQFGLVAGRQALADAAFTPGEGGAADPDRTGIYLGSALGGIAFAEEQHERYLDRGIRRSARPSRWPCSVARPRPIRDRPRRPRADPVDRELVRVGRRGDRRGARGDPGRRDRRCRWRVAPRSR